MLVQRHYLCFFRVCNASSGDDFTGVSCHNIVGDCPVAQVDKDDLEGIFDVLSHVEELLLVNVHLDGQTVSALKRSSVSDSVIKQLFLALVEQEVY